MKIKRNCFNKLWDEISEPQISIILGARQVGKSTLMRQLQSKAKRSGYKTAFYDLEQPSDLNRLAGTDQDVITEITKSAQVVFIDEFHYIKNASKIFKAIYDKGKSIKIYASGSSSLSIHKHLKESLSGRFKKTIIYPLNLKEWQKTPNFKIEQYLQWGGMPGLIHQTKDDARVELLENIVSTYITKDIKGLIKEENIRSFNSLLYILAQSQGSMVIVSNLARETGLKEMTVARHLEIISQTYVLYVIQSFSQNLANELKKSKKYYLFDIGIRNLLLKDFKQIDDREDKGTIYESVILLHLQSQIKPNMEIRFWRTKKGDEVDFVLLKNRIPIPIEVKSNLTSPKVPGGLSRFLKRYPNAPFGLVFNENIKTVIKLDKRLVYFKHWHEVLDLDFLKTIV
jgi:hypothetical protein